MSPDIATLPYLGTLTATEVHAFAVAFVPALLIGLTRARRMVRLEPWYAAAGLLVGLALGWTLAWLVGWV